MSKLLINESPLQVLPSLAVKVGLNGAIVLQQLHYWEQNKRVGKESNGRKWVKNSFAQWQEDNFPFWSERTIQRIVSKLEDDGLIDTRQDLNQSSHDRTKWYSINHNALLHDDNVSCSHDDNVSCSHDDNVAPCTIYTETTTETTAESKAAAAAVMSAYMDNVGLPGVYETEILEELENEYTAEWVLDAIKEAAKSRVKNIKYIEAILKRWAKEGKNNSKSSTTSLIQQQLAESAEKLGLYKD